ncbi:MAG: DUF6363 domain-containing protein [Spirochaetota bacterium]
MGITGCETGEAVFVESNSLNPGPLKQLLSASSAIPFLSRRINFGGDYYLDGGIADSIPLMKAMDGCSRAVVILTRNGGYRKKPMPCRHLVRGYFRKDPKLARVLLSRPERYNDTLDLIEKLEQEGKVFVIRPRKKVEVSKIENNPDKLQNLYNSAIEEMEDVMPALNKWLQRR